MLAVECFCEQSVNILFGKCFFNLFWTSFFLLIPFPFCVLSETFLVLPGRQRHCLRCVQGGFKMLLGTVYTRSCQMKRKVCVFKDRQSWAQTQAPCLIYGLLDFRLPLPGLTCLPFSPGGVVGLVVVSEEKTDLRMLSIWSLGFFAVLGMIALP